MVVWVEREGVDAAEVARVGVDDGGVGGGGGGWMMEGDGSGGVVF